MHLAGAEKEMNQNTFCSKCHRTPNQCCCNTASKELSDEEIVNLYESLEYKNATSNEKYDAIQFARAILKKASEK